MKTKTAIGLLKRQLGQIAALKSGNRTSPQFDQWWSATRSVVARLYGDHSSVMSQFEAKLASSGIFTSTTPEAVHHQVFLERLADVEAFLHSLIHEIEEWGAYALPVNEAELKHHYTGVFGAKVFWSAVFTLLPILVSLKLPDVGIHMSPATLFYSVYHVLGIYVWAQIRQLYKLHDAPEVKRNSLIACGRVHWAVSKLGWVVAVLVIVTFLAKMQLEFLGHHRVPMPDWVKQFVGVR